MTIVHRVLHPHPITSFDEYLVRRGGRGWDAVAALTPDQIIEELLASGLRGRGGAGFPTGIKWRTVADNRSQAEATSVVVNAAEGEPGTYKDRTILQVNPYQVIEGALIAARAVQADQIIFGLKAAFTDEGERIESAVREIEAAGWTDGIEVVVFEGPDHYLYGEETGMLEAIDGRPPFPRIAPPFRRGVREVVETDDDLHTGSGLSAHVEMAGAEGSEAPPTLVDNVETLANVAHIFARGPEWFRTEGTEQSPGTLVVTVSGAVEHAAVGEVMMGTTLRDAIDAIGGGGRPGHTIKAVMSGTSNALIPASMLDTPLTYEDMAAIGAGLGSGGYIVYDEEDDLTAVAAGVSRFLAVESCGQCTPCKQDGLAIAELLRKVCHSEATARDVESIRSRLGTIADGARCYLATQHQVMVESVFDLFPEEVEVHLHGAGGALPQKDSVPAVLISEMLGITDGVAVYDERHATKQPDWTYDAEWSGQMPAERLDDHRMAGS